MSPAVLAKRFCVRDGQFEESSDTSSQCPAQWDNISRVRGQIGTALSAPTVCLSNIMNS